MKKAYSLVVSRLLLRSSLRVFGASIATEYDHSAFESPTKQLLWRGNVSDDLTGNPEKNSEKLSKDIASMFKRFSPSH